MPYGTDRGESTSYTAGSGDTSSLSGRAAAVQRAGAPSGTGGRATAPVGSGSTTGYRDAMPRQPTGVHRPPAQFGGGGQSTPYGALQPGRGAMPNPFGGGGSPFGGGGQSTGFGQVMGGGVPGGFQQFIQLQQQQMLQRLLSQIMAGRSDFRPRGF